MRVPVKGGHGGYGAGDMALGLRRVLPSAWEPEVQKSMRSMIGLGTPDPGNPGRGENTTPFQATSLGPPSGSQYNKGSATETN